MTGPLEAPMDTEVNGIPFSVLISQAAKLKTAQAAPSRSKYDGYPSFYQHSIYPREKVSQARLKDFHERMADAIEMKNEGNEAFKQLRFDDAIVHHEMAIAVFRFLENINPAWQSEVRRNGALCNTHHHSSYLFFKGIKDEFIREHCFESGDEDEKTEVNNLLLTCYTNMAVIANRAMKFKLAIEACDEAIIMDKTNVKALFLRSIARIKPKSARSADEHLATKDLELAMEISPGNRHIR